MHHFSSWFQRTLIPLVLLALTACPSAAVPKPASIEGFTATPNTLPAGGGTVKLEWNVSNAQNILIGPNIGSVSGNSR